MTYVENVTPVKWKCECGKSYKHDSGYYRHRKKCQFINNKKEEENQVDTNEPTYKELLITAISEMRKENKELLTNVIDILQRIETKIK
jgi:hypothetical protein